MVSSKCCHVESPSPLRFLAALMPPCAQTECDRLTGTIENRSTLPPASAILMTAASPARPPPTTMILGDAMNFPFGEQPLAFSCWLVRYRLKAGHIEDTACGRTNQRGNRNVFRRVG